MFSSERSYEHLFKKISEVIAFIIFLTGILVLIGWKYDVLLLRSFNQSLSPMSANTAFCFILTGMSLYTLQSKRIDLPAGYAGKVFAFLICIIAILTISEYLFSVNFGIDELLCKQNVGKGFEHYPGRMAPSSAWNFILIGISLLCLNLWKTASYRPSQYIILFVGVNSFLSITGYLLDVFSLFTISVYKPVALNSAICFMFTSVSVLLARPDEGFVKLFSGNNTAGYILRHILFISFSSLALLGMLCFLCRISGIYSIPLGFVIFLIANIAVFIFLLYSSSSLINSLELKYDRTLNDLKMSEEKFQSLVSCAQDAIIILEEGKIIFVNDSAVKIFGYSFEEVKGKEFHVFLSSTLYPTSERLRMSTVNVREDSYVMSKICEIVALKKNGDEFPAEMSITAVKLGDKWNTIGIIRDMSGYKKYCDNLEKKNEEMEKTVKKLKEDIEKLNFKIGELESNSTLSI